MNVKEPYCGNENLFSTSSTIRGVAQARDELTTSLPEGRLAVHSSALTQSRRERPSWCETPLKVVLRQDLVRWNFCSYGKRG